MFTARIGLALLACALPVVAQHGPDTAVAIAALQSADGGQRVAAALWLADGRQAAALAVLELLATDAPTLPLSPLPKPRVARARRIDPIERALVQPDSLLPETALHSSERFLIPEIREAADLRNSRWPTRQVAAWLLGEIGVATPAVVEGLARAARHDDLALRLQALQTMSALARSRPEWLATIARALGDERVSRPAALLLVEHGRAGASLLIAALRTGNDEARTEAALALRNIEPRWAMAATDALIEQITAAEPRVFRAAIGALQHIGRPAVPALLASLAGNDPIASERAAGTLALLGPRAREAVLVMTGEMRTATPLRIQWLAQALGAMPIDAPRQTAAAVEWLLAASRYSSPPVRSAAATALGSFAHAERAVQRLREMAAHEEPVTCIAATRALQRAGTPATEACANLANIYRDGNLEADLRGAAFTALVNIGAPAVPLVVDLVANAKSPPEGDGLAGFTQQAQRAVLAILDDADPGRRAAAARVLSWIDTIDDDSLHALAAHADDETLVTDAVLTTLRRHARQHPAAVLPGLIAIARRGSELQKHALEALSTIGADAAPAIPILCEALRSTASPIRARAARALGKIGAPATVAIPDLERVARDPVRLVAAHAAQALVNIRGH